MDIMLDHGKLCWIAGLLVTLLHKSAQQCTQPALPAVIAPTGGDSPKKADGVWYIYRQLGRTTTINPRIQITSVVSIVEPINNLPAWLQWWVIALHPNGNTTACQNQFWTGTFSIGGQEIGDQGNSDDDYIMRPTDYVVLHHDYDNLMVHYQCMRAGTNGLCANPQIYARTRKRPDQLSQTEADAFDAIIISFFAKYCVTLKDIPKNTFTDTVTVCPFVDPPFCVAQDIQGMKNFVRNITSQSTVSSNYNSGASTPSSGCKWPNSIASPAKIDPKQNAGFFYLYRRMFAPEPIPIQQVVMFHDVGPSTSPLIGSSAHTFWVEYSHYHALNATDCAQGFYAGTIGEDGLLTGLLTPSTAAGAPQPFTMRILRLDETSLLFYGCDVPNLQTGVCSMPNIVHLTRNNPATTSQAEKDSLDALENSFFSQYGCSANDVPVSDHSAGKPQCPFVPPTECVQKHITGYEQVFAPTSTGSTCY